MLGPIIVSNRQLLYLTLGILGGLGALFILNITAILTSQPAQQTYLKYNDIRGMAVVHNHLPYTLNFQQQNDVVDCLNQSVRVVGVKPNKRKKPAIEKIIIYLFGNKHPVEVTPVAYIDENLVFSAPELGYEGYFMENSQGGLKNLLSKTYDP